jgi:hypothetical protein
MRQITQCFHASLASIHKQAEQLGTLTRLVQDKLAQPSSNTPVPCQVNSFKNGCLVLAVTDPVWAAKLRYEIPSLRDQLRREGLHQLTSIRISLSPGGASEPLTPRKKPTRTPSLSNQAKQTITSSAKHCSYAPLREALERLGANQASTKDNSG